MRDSLGPSEGPPTRRAARVAPVNAAPTPSIPPTAATAYAEAFVPSSEHDAAARAAAQGLGIGAISPGTSALLTFLASTIEARTAVEVGTGAGVASLALLTGMPEGILTSIDAEPEHQSAARRVLTDAGIPARRARLIAGAALQVLPKLSDGAYDLVFIDGDPLEAVEYVEEALRLLRPGGLLAIYHALSGGRVSDAGNEDDDTVIMREALAAVADSEQLSPVLLPVGDGVLVARRS